MARLRSVRKGRCGAFVLRHDDTGPMLCVHMNNSVAYLWFVRDPNGEHPGFHPTGMSPADCCESVHFTQTDGLETEGLMVSRDNVLSVDAAHRAAVEFLQEPGLQASISWLDLEELHKTISDRG